ncbi:MAG: hypothetical protein O3A46_17330, partial [Candidatus Poribacteria bacterium]|nr:hypothetical protein [Candidatus Poribacteria bacterium]
MLLTLTVGAVADTIIWNGSSSNGWDDIYNWSPETLPTSGDTAIISGSHTITMDSTESVGAISLSGGAVLTLGGGGTSLTVGAVTVDASTFRMTDASAVSWTSGDWNFLNGGLFTQNSSGYLTITAGSNITGDGTGTFINNGVIDYAGEDATTISGVTFYNNDFVDTDSNLTIIGDGSDTGAYDVDSAATLTFQNGERYLEGSGFHVHHNQTAGGGLTFVNSTVNWTDGVIEDVTVTVDATSTFVLSGEDATDTTVQSEPTLRLNGSVDNNGTVQWVGGHIYRFDYGSFDNYATGVFQILTASHWVQEMTYTISNEGLITIDPGAGAVDFYDSVYNHEGGVIEIESGDVNFHRGGSNDGGTIAIATGSTLTANGTFNNDGDIWIDPGASLILNGGGVDTGEYYVYYTATLEFAAGTRTLESGSALEFGSPEIYEPATLVFSGGTTTIEGSVTYDSNLDVTGGAVYFYNTEGGVSFDSVTLSGGTLGAAALTVATDATFTFSDDGVTTPTLAVQTFSNSGQIVFAG